MWVFFVFVFCILSESESVSHWVVSDSLWPHGLWPAKLLCPWNSPGKNTGVGCHFLLQGIFPTQGLNPGLLHCSQILYQLSHQGRSPLYFKYIRVNGNVSMIFDCGVINHLFCLWYAKSIYLRFFLLLLLPAVKAWFLTSTLRILCMRDFGVVFFIGLRCT